MNPLGVIQRSYEMGRQLSGLDRPVGLGLEGDQWRVL